MTTIQDVLAARNDEARKAIDECLNGIPAADEYRPTIEREDSALYVLLRAAYFAGRDAGIRVATPLVSDLEPATSTNEGKRR